MLFMSHTRLVKANLLNLSVLASTPPVLMLEEAIRVFILLMDPLMRVPLPLKLHQQEARMIHFLWRVPLTLMGLLGVSEENSTFLQKACLLASTCSAKTLGSMRLIVGGWLKSFIGMRKNQKEMAAILNLPHSPVHEKRTFDPPSPVPNPWEDLGSWVPVDDKEEEYEDEEDYDEDAEE
jgi:hypothetical protein